VWGRIVRGNIEAPGYKVDSLILRDEVMALYRGEK